jgi:hypothetical protein
VAALVAAHGGAVWVESPPGGGASFQIALPLAPEARQSGPESDETPVDESPQPDIIEQGTTEHGTIASGRETLSADRPHLSGQPSAARALRAASSAASR